MARSQLNVSALYASLDAARQERKLSWRQLAKEVEISPSTLSRMANGHRPDVDAFGALVAWLGMPAEDFLESDDGQPTTQPGLVAQLAPLLRARDDLSAADVKHLEDLITAAINRFNSEQAE